LAPAALAVDPSSLAFGSVTVGQSLRRTVTVRNDGEAPLQLATATLSGTGFTLVANACDGATLTAAQACAIDVQFAPAVAGAATGTLTIAHGNSATATVALQGDGTPVPPAGAAIFRSGFE
jgi:hypothetical protein